MKKWVCRRHLSKLPKPELEDAGDGFDQVKQAKPDGTVTQHVTEPARLTCFYACCTSVPGAPYT